MMAGGITILVFALAVVQADHWMGDFTNDFAVELYDESADVADLVATSHGCRKVRKLENLGNIYHFQHPQVSHRTKRSADNILSRLLSDPNVKSVEQQRILFRDKREVIHDKQVELPIRHYEDKSVYQYYEHAGGLAAKDGIPDGRPELVFSDPLFKYQWYLNNKGQSGGPEGLDSNVMYAWEKNFTGAGVKVTILDDGIEHNHPDLKKNYDPKASGDLNDDNDSDPMPNEKDASNSHGTRCAGEVAATANNSVCGVGIAYDAHIGGVRMLDGRVTDLLEARAINWNYDYVDIYSASWGPRDDGKTMEAPGTYCSKALKKGVEKGRGGKGSIFIWATGNGGMNQDDCSADGYVSSIYSLSVGCISDEGRSTYFTEVCPSTMAVVYTGGSHASPGEPDYKRPKLKVTTTDLHGDCTLEFQGTSSAAPLAAGCVALALQANNSLTWRDVQYLVVETAKVTNPKESGWVLNGAGKHVNHKFGFGVLDCSRMVEAAQRWVHVPEQHICEAKPSTSKPVEIKSRGSIQQTVTTEGCLNNKDKRINQLEHVQVKINLKHSFRGDVILTIISPSGTKSEILSLRPKDSTSEGIDFTFMTVHNWGEDPNGEWTLVVEDHPNYSQRTNTGQLVSWSLILYGIWNETNVSNGQSKTSRSQDDQVLTRSLSTEELKRIVMDETEKSRRVSIRYNGNDPQPQSTYKHHSSSEMQENELEGPKLTKKDYDSLLSLFKSAEKSKYLSKKELKLAAELLLKNSDKETSQAERSFRDSVREEMGYFDDDSPEEPIRRQDNKDTINDKRKLHQASEDLTESDVDDLISWLQERTQN